MGKGRVRVLKNSALRITDDTSSHRNAVYFKSSSSRCDGESPERAGDSSRNSPDLISLGVSGTGSSCVDAVEVVEKGGELGVDAF